MCKQVRDLVKNYLLALSLILGLGVISPPAHAVTFDFIALVDDPLVAGVGEGDWDAQPIIGAGVGWTVGGINVNATANGTNFAYLDKFSAGLGVCKILDGSGFCDPSDDDNIQSGEELTLTFDRTLTLTALLFKNAVHELFSGTVLINTVSHTVVSGVLAAVLVADNSVWTFGFGGDYAAEFYVSSVNAVPLPAAGILFGSALAGIGFLSRRRRNKQNTQAII